MVESSKILTVSYGTFSCTLEGFDDSFSTMKVIAEYFRDLAADDRYFGAEPPVPDAAMLAKIAERGNTRRVDARTQDGGIVLRASAAVAPAMPPQVSRPDPAQVAAVVVSQKDQTLDEFQSALSDPTVDNAQSVAGPAAGDTVSAPRKAASQATPHGLTFDDMDEAPRGVPAHPDTQSVAAKLQRIRAVVGKTPETSQDAEFADAWGASAMPAFADPSHAAPVEESDFHDDDAMLDGLTAKVAQEPPVIRAQILRIRKADTTEAPAVDPYVLAAENAIKETDCDDNVADLDMSITTSLSDDDEADLIKELAEVERDFNSAQQEVPAAQDVTAQKPRTSLPETDDATMSHILTQTDQQLSEPEGSRRRDAIAQLKAAVAATEAARQLGDNGHDQDEAEGAFREDLNDVVRPITPTAARPTRVKPSETRTERPRPAPLKLVASQRVDTQHPAQAAASVKPRRVATAAEPISPAVANNFAAFAEEMGASSLPDLFEAAAAHTAFVEGVEDFSRPQIMKKVQSSTETEFSREDGLRSFGTLLRQGRISKVRNGRFQVSQESRFKPETKVG